MIVDSYAQAYHWTYDEIISRTLPQIIMLNHASSVNKRRFDAKVNKGRRDNTQTLEERIVDTPMWNGKRIDELTSEEYLEYHRSAMMD